MSRYRLLPAPAQEAVLRSHVNAAVNIAAGHVVTARGGDGITRPVNREPHLLASLTRTWVAGILRLQAEEDVN